MGIERGRGLLVWFAHSAERVPRTLGMCAVLLAVLGECTEELDFYCMSHLTSGVHHVIVCTIRGVEDKAIVQYRSADGSGAVMDEDSGTLIPKSVAYADNMITIVTL